MSSQWTQINSFLMTQLALEASKDEHHRGTYIEEINKLRNQIEDLATQKKDEYEVLLEKNNQLELQLRAHDQEDVELKEAYKEKHRKCVAWEKVGSYFQNSIFHFKLVCNFTSYECGP